MCKITALLGMILCIVALPLKKSKAAGVTQSAQVRVIGDILFLSQEEVQSICNEDPWLERCNIVIINDEADTFFEVEGALTSVALRRGEYPLRMIDFE